ncbi:MAG: hypothetical protein E6L00_08180 [Thaumarchaeota archaeon]|nr:MAG: hypothetical protein E6L00_08180 [Nitrososphaerota archaeon]
MKWIAIGVAAVIAAAVIVIVDLPIYQQPKPSTGNANTKPQTDLTTSQSKTNPTGLPGNAYTNPPIDAMGMMHFHPHLTLIIDSKPAPFLPT